MKLTGHLRELAVGNAINWTPMGREITGLICDIIDLQREALEEMYNHGNWAAGVFAQKTLQRTAELEQRALEMLR